MAAGALSAAGFADPRRHARRLVASALSIAPSDLFGHPERIVNEDEIRCVREILRRALDREPLSRIQKKREFWGLPFALSPETLDPRPETESVVEAVVRQVPDRQGPVRVVVTSTVTG